MQTQTKPEVTYTVKTAPGHPLARKFGISERQFRRAVQNGLIDFARPGGLVIRFTDKNIADFIEGSVNAPINRSDAR